MQPYKIIRTDRKTIALQIDEEARLIVRAPHFVSLQRINKFIDEKQDWIYKKQKQAEKAIKHIEQNKEFKDGKIVYFMGGEYAIRLNGKIKNIELKDDFMEFPYKHIENAEEFLIKWYKRKAKDTIIPKTEQYAKELGLSYKKISISSAKNRWGSCNTNGNINFSFKLIMAPEEIIDYVIVHELMHIKEHNHSNRFWKLVEHELSDYKARKKWLKDNGYRLTV